MGNIMDTIYWTHMRTCHEKQWSIFLPLAVTCCKKKKTNTGDALISHPHAKKNPLQFYKLVLSIQVTT